MHWGVARARAALALVAVGAVAALALSGGSSSDPRTPRGAAGTAAALPAVAVVGAGGLTAGIDAYGDVVDLRAPGPAGRGADRQPPRAAGGGQRPGRHRDRPAGLRRRWAAAAALARRLGPPALPAGDERAAHRGALRRDPGRNQVRSGRVAARPASADTAGESPVEVSFGRNLPAADGGCISTTAWRARIVGTEVVAGTALARAAPGRSGRGAPGWARAMYGRSLLVLRALTDRRSGAVAAGARDGWAYVWPRDAGAVALALASAGYRAEARRVARFLLGLDLDAAARFDGDGGPGPGPGRPGRRGRLGGGRGRAAAGLRRTAAPARHGGTAPTTRRGPAATTWATRSPSGPRPAAVADSGPSGGWFAGRTSRGSGLDSAAAWAVRPFPQPALFPAAPQDPAAARAPRAAASASSPPRTGAAARTPGRRRPPGPPGASRRSASAAPPLRLLADLRRAATPAGLLPERVDAAPASRGRPRRSPGPTPSRSSPCASSGPDLRETVLRGGAHILAAWRCARRRSRTARRSPAG